MKNIHKIVSHFFLGHNDLLSSIDYEVASLVIGTFSFGDNLCFGKIAKGAELRSDHYWHFSYWNFFLGFIVNQLLFLAFFLFINFILNVQEQLGLISEVSQSSLKRSGILNHSFTGYIGRLLMNIDLLKIDLIKLSFVFLLFISFVLSCWKYFDLSYLCDDFLKCASKEIVE